METNLIRCVNAYTAAEELAKQEWPYREAYTLMRLNRALRQEAEYYLREETKLMLEYGEKDENGQVKMTGPGTFLLERGKSAEEYRRKKEELAEVAVALEWEETAMGEPERIRPIHLEALEGFLQFNGGKQ